MRAMSMGLLASVLLLAGCVDDRAAYEADNSQVITIIREQPLPWSDKVEYSMVVARMPDCMRRHPIGYGTPQTIVEIGQYYADAFVVKIDNRYYAAETATCEKLEKLKEPPKDGLGEMRGVFRVVNGTFAFVPDTGGKPKTAAK